MRHSVRGVLFATAVTLLAVALLTPVIGQNPKSAVYPDAVPTDSTLGVYPDLKQTPLTAAAGATATTLTVHDATVFRYPVYLVITYEKIRACSGSGTTITVCPSGRGVDGTAAVAHYPGEDVITYVSPDYVRQLQAEVKAIAGALGVTPQLTRGFFVPAASCQGTSAAGSFNTFSTNGPVPSCVTGTNVTKGVLLYSGTSGAVTLGSFTVLVPASFTSNGQVKVNVQWSTSATSGVFKAFIGIACTSVDGTETDDPVPTYTAVTSTAPGVANRMTSLTTGYITGCASNKLMNVFLKRDKNDSADTLAANVAINSVEGVYR